MSPAERVAENLNRALHGAFEEFPDLYLLGEDVADPYGGAFKITKGLSTRFPDRLISTPISEGAIVGVANGLALSGDRAITEIMFSDFVTLAFDQIVNFAAKSVAMYGRPVPMPVIIRCPTGGGRGYGPTHSQSLQKHFVGVPHLSLHEISPFHDNRSLIGNLLRGGRPAILFEDKVLYGQRMYQHGVVDDLIRFDFIGAEESIARAYIDDPGSADCAIIAPGGVALRALAAARALFLEQEISCQVLIPSRLYPFAAERLLPDLRRVGLVCVVEDSQAGGTWGTQVAVQIYEGLWGELRRPVLLCSAAGTIIPTAGHLEREVLPQAESIYDAIVRSMHA